MLRRVLFLLLLGAGAALLLRAYVVEAIYIASGSMEPTLYVGERAFIDKLSYVWKTPARGDIVSFASPREPSKGLVKRVIAIGGDEVLIREKQVILNGRPLVEPYIKHTRPQERFADDNLEVGRVPAGHVFLLGDNRDASDDSRNWSDPKTGSPVYFIPVKKLAGKLVGAH